MNDVPQEELVALTGAFFALGIIYKLKLENKHGGKVFTEADIKEMEDKLVAAVSNLSHGAQNVFNNMKINNDMGLITDVYQSWPSMN